MLIVGGGPAGLAAAIAARQKGFAVIVMDGMAPPIDKACGEGMMPETLAVLNELGIKFQPGDGQHFRGISFVQDDAAVAADFPEGHAIGLRRPMLHQRLLERAQQCGVRFLWNTSLSAIDGNVARFSNGTFRANWIIGADGHGSRVRRCSGLDSTAAFTLRFATRRHYHIAPWSSYAENHWSKHAQAYVTPIGAAEICVVVMAENRCHASFENALTQMPKLNEKLSGAYLSSRERGAVTAMRSLRHVYRNNVALLGDASGGVDAITGEGLRMAFRQALALADAMANGDLSQYQRAHRQIARRPMLMGRLLLWLGRNPRIRARAIRAMQQRPELFARVLSAHVGAATSAQILSTGASLGWQFLAA